MCGGCGVGVRAAAVRAFQGTAAVPHHADLPAVAADDLVDLEAGQSDDRSCADPGRAMADLPAQMERGFTTFCLKPSQFTDDPSGMAALCKDVMRRAEAMARR